MSCSTRRSRCTEAFVPRSSRSVDGVLIDDFGVLDLMVRLVEKSLVHLEADGTEACYRLLETIRYYAQERLVEVGESGATRERHLAFFLAFSEAAAPELAAGSRLARLAQLDHHLDRPSRARAPAGNAASWSE